MQVHSLLYLTHVRNCQSYNYERMNVRLWSKICVCTVSKLIRPLNSAHRQQVPVSRLTVPRAYLTLKIFTAMMMTTMTMMMVTFENENHSKNLMMTSFFFFLSNNITNLAASWFGSVIEVSLLVAVLDPVWRTILFRAISIIKTEPSFGCRLHVWLGVFVAWTSVHVHV